MKKQKWFKMLIYAQNINLVLCVNNCNEPQKYKIIHNYAI